MSSCGDDFGFLGYIVNTLSPPAEFFAFVYSYSGLAFLLIYPFVLCGRLNNASDKSLLSGISGGLEDELVENEGPADCESEQPTGGETSSAPSVSEAARQKPVGARAVSDLPSNATSKKLKHHGLKGGASSSQLDHGSAIPSRVNSATTSKLYQGSSVGSSVSGVSRTILPNGSRSRRNRKPITNAGVLQRAVRKESRMTEERLARQNIAAGSSSWPMTRKGVPSSKRGISDLASSVLDAGSAVSGSAIFARPTKGRIRRMSKSNSLKSGQWESQSEAEISIMPSIVDNISPDEAADANDPGKVRDFNASGSEDMGVSERFVFFASWMRGPLDLAEPDEELRRVMALSAPISVQSLGEALLRLVMIGTISFQLGTDSMVAFVLVLLIVRLSTEEVAVAITDALSTVIQNILSAGGGKDTLFEAGKYVQLAVIMQLLVGIPLAFLLHIFLEDIVTLLVSSDYIATPVPCLARGYFDIVISSFIAQGVCRTIVAPCQVRGHESIDSQVDMIASMALVVTSLILLIVRDEAVLTDVAWIQLNVGVAGSVVKVAFVYLRGWLDPFWSGLALSPAFLDVGAFTVLISTSIPLFMGSFLEVGEVDLFTFLIPKLGKAEVAAWIVLGVLWEALEAATEGISEAAAIRVAYQLSDGQPDMAKKVVHKALFWSAIESLLVASILLMAGRVIVINLTEDPTLQHLLDDVVCYMAFANVPMVFAQISWSLLGAQGRFSLATVVVLACRWLVTIPFTLICIFVYTYKLDALACCIAVGSSTASCALSFFLLTSDWNELSLAMQGFKDDDDDFDFSFDEDDDSDDSSFDMLNFNDKDKVEDSIPTGTVSGTSQSGSAMQSATGGSAVNSGLSGLG